MGVFIPTEMPQKCYECFYEHYCELVNPYYVEEQRPVDCPLISVELDDVPSDLIKRQDAIDCFWDKNRMMRDCLDIIKDIRSLPSAEHKYGEWIQHVNEPSLWSCSICETVIYSEHEEDRLKFHKWCGCCGADMRERRVDERLDNES